MQERKNPSSAQDFFAYSIKEKRRRGFSTLDLPERFRAVRNLQRVRSAKFPAQELCAY